MNSLNRSTPMLLLTLTLSGLLGIGLASLAQAGASSPGSLDNRSNTLKNNPYDSPVRRANPNSRQGTESSIPSPRGTNTTANPRPPTLENGGIGNGYPTRRQPSAGPSSNPSRDSN